MHQHFCHLPWAGIDIGNDGKIRPCCKFQEDLEKWPQYNVKDGIKNYLSSPELNTLKQKFIEGKKPAGCARCWKDEDANYISKRLIDYRQWKNEFDDYDFASEGFLLVTLPFGNLCNIKCRICGPKASSSWIKEAKDLFDKQGSVQNWHKDPEIWKDVLGHIKDCLEFNITGGEPFLYDNDEHNKLLEALVESGNSSKIRLHYTTNCTVYPKKYHWEMWKHFKSIDIQASIDDTGNRYEYNRYPAKWDIAKENLIKLRNNALIYDNVQLSISTTVSVFTVFYLDEFFDFITENKLPTPWLGRLQDPYYYRVNVLPDKIRELAQQKLFNSSYSDLQKIAIWLDDDESEHWEKFLEITNMQDRYRKESFSDTFSELFELIDK